jgi:hypothetical protein
MADPTFAEVLKSAMDDVERRGFLSIEQVKEWERRLAEALRRSFTPDAVMKTMVDRALVRLYEQMVDQAKILKFHPGVPRFTLERIKPHLRPELDKRIALSLNLIRLNKESVVSKMQQRFSGWASSVPAGGSDHSKAREAKDTLKKGLSGLRFEERRVLIDQGAKLVSSINATLAQQGNAIAAVWRSHAHQQNYDFRVQHAAYEVESLRRPFLVRDSWIIKDGLVKTTGARYTDDVEQPAELPFCRCAWSWKYNLRQLPRDMLTKQGEEFLENAARKRAALA